MPEATPTITPIPSGAIITIALSAPKLRASRDRPLRAACRAAAATHDAMLALASSVAELVPDDPRHVAAHEAAARLRPQWQQQVAQICRMPAALDEIPLKAALLGSLVGRDDTDTAIAPPASRLTMSLIEDVLAHEWDTAG